MIVTSVVVFPSAVLLVFAGPFILGVVSRGHYAASHLEFGLLVLASGLSAFWMSMSVVLVSINRQGEFTYLMVFLYAALVSVPFISGNQLSTVMAASAFVEGVILFVVFQKTMRHL